MIMGILLCMSYSDFMNNMYEDMKKSKLDTIGLVSLDIVDENFVKDISIVDLNMLVPSPSMMTTYIISDDKQDTFYTRYLKYLTQPAQLTMLCTIVKYLLEGGSMTLLCSDAEMEYGYMDKLASAIDALFDIRTFSILDFKHNPSIIGDFQDSVDRVGLNKKIDKYLKAIRKEKDIKFDTNISKAISYYNTWSKEDLINELSRIEIYRDEKTKRKELVYLCAHKCYNRLH